MPTKLCAIVDGQISTRRRQWAGQMTIYKLTAGASSVAPVPSFKCGANG